MGEQDKKAVTDVFAWFLNVSTSVVIVFINKVLMDDKKGYRFVFGKLMPWPQNFATLVLG